MKADGPRAEEHADGDMDGEEDAFAANEEEAAVGDASTLSVDKCLPTNLRSECDCDCGDALTDGEW